MLCVLGMLCVCILQGLTDASTFSLVPFFLVSLSQACTCIIIFFNRLCSQERKKAESLFVLLDVLFFIIFFKVRNAKERIKGYMQSGVKCGVHV
ncbi:MAG: hypothetical protein BYD32DRAFT_431668, partial [Podila humilis]